MDLVTFVPTEIIRLMEKEIEEFVFPQSENNFGVDAYIVEEYKVGHKDYFKFASDKAYWLEKFTKTRRIRGNKLAKGYLEIYT